MNKMAAKVFGLVILLLAVVGVFVSGRLFSVVNVDIALDLVRFGLAAALLYVGFSKASEDTASGAVMAVGILYVGLVLPGMLSREVFGLLPSGLTGFDLLFHIVAGITAVVVASQVGGMHHPGSTHHTE